jgi:hypothetical protein
MDAKENPYQSPQSAADAVALPSHRNAGPRWARPYASGHARAIVVILLLTILILLMSLIIAYHICLLRQPVYSSPDKRDVASLMAALKWVYHGLAVSSGWVVLTIPIAFLMWIHRAYRNLPALMPESLHYSPRWAVGCFFIPILNLFRPYQVMREIWQGSDPSRLGHVDDSVESVKESSAAVVGWWWGLFLFQIIGRQAARLFIVVNSASAFVVAVWIAVGFALTGIAVCIAAILMVYRVDANQSRRHDIVLQQPLGSASPSGTGDQRLVY